MQFDRRWAYAAVILGYYVFVVVFGLRTGLLILTSTLIVGAMSYLWFFLAASKGGYMLLTLRDLVLNVGVYSFISFLVIFVDWQLTLAFYKEYNSLKLLLSLPSVVMWVGVWIDFYRQRIAGNL